MSVYKKMDELLLSLTDEEREVLAEKLNKNCDEREEIEEESWDIQREIDRLDGIKLSRAADSQLLRLANSEQIFSAKAATIEKIHPLVISGFPGIGKSTFFKENWSKMRVSDSDSSEFSWIYNSDGTKERNPDFPSNYIKHIQYCIDNGIQIIFVSTHKDVINALIEAKIKFSIVCPSRYLKDEYLKRYKERGSDESFINLMDSKWDSFLDDIDSYDNVRKIHLAGPNLSVADVIKQYLV